MLGQVGAAACLAVLWLCRTELRVAKVAPHSCARCVPACRLRSWGVPSLPALHSSAPAAMQVVHALKPGSEVQQAVLLLHKYSAGASPRGCFGRRPVCSLFSECMPPRPLPAATVACWVGCLPACLAHAGARVPAPHSPLATPFRLPVQPLPARKQRAAQMRCWSCRRLCHRLARGHGSLLWSFRWP